MAKEPRVHGAEHKAFHHRQSRGARGAALTEPGSKSNSTPSCCRPQAGGAGEATTGKSNLFSAQDEKPYKFQSRSGWNGYCLDE
jgi:hypothetical protein